MRISMKVEKISKKKLKLKKNENFENNRNCEKMKIEKTKIANKIKILKIIETVKKWKLRKLKLRIKLKFWKMKN